MISMSYLIMIFIVVGIIFCCAGRALACRGTAEALQGGRSGGHSGVERSAGFGRRGRKQFPRSERIRDPASQACPQSDLRIDQPSEYRPLSVEGCMWGAELGCYQSGSEHYIAVLCDRAISEFLKSFFCSCDVRMF